MNLTLAGDYKLHHPFHVECRLRIPSIRALGFVRPGAHGIDVQKRALCLNLVLDVHGSKKYATPGRIELPTDRLRTGLP